MRLHSIVVLGVLPVIATLNTSFAQTAGTRAEREERRVINERRAQQNAQQPYRYTQRYYYGQGSRSRPADPGPGSTATPNR